MSQFLQYRTLKILGSLVDIHVNESSVHKLHVNAFSPKGNLYFYLYCTCMMAVSASLLIKLWLTKL